jgi:hypothetical protein
MASTSLTVQIPLIAGVTVVASASVGSGDTVTLQAATAQGTIDMASLCVRITASLGSVTPTINVGTRYSNVILGAKTCSVIASSATAIIGGKDFEDSRFMTTANNVVLSFIGTGTSVVEAYARAPGAIGY